MKDTVADFWKMMKGYKSRCIVLLCNLRENEAVSEAIDISGACTTSNHCLHAQETCHPYWPQQVNETMAFGKLTITLQSEEDYGDYCLRKIELTENKGKIGAVSSGYSYRLTSSY